jgi:hypothetical protein
MSRQKPNAVCSCGSGRKYKKCCGATPTGVINSPVAVPQHNENPKLEGTWGLSGTEIMMNVRAHYADPEDARNFAHPGGDKGKYKVTFVFSKPNYAPQDERQFTVDGSAIPGNSHLHIGNSTDGTLFLAVNLPDQDYKFKCYSNESGCLSRIEIEDLEADFAKDALRKAYNALSPVLSRLSLLLDVPLHLFSVTVYETAAHAFLSSFQLPYLVRQLPAYQEISQDSGFRRYASLYREALNSTSPNYQYLCFYKIIEGIRKQRELRNKEENESALQAGKKPDRPREILPTEKTELAKWLNALLPPQRWSDLAIEQVFPLSVRGKKINDIISHSRELDTIRNRIAHAILRDESAETLSIDDAEHVAEVHTWLPLCKCMAIYLLRREFPSEFQPANGLDS